MKIEITNEEYRTLLDVLHVAEVVLSGHRRQEDPRSEQHRMLIQKLYALAGDAGLGQLIEFDNARKRYHPTEEFENNAPAHSFVDEFADHVFWDELISRLTARDAAWQAGGLERLNALSTTNGKHWSGRSTYGMSRSSRSTARQPGGRGAL